MAGNVSIMALGRTAGAGRRANPSLISKLWLDRVVLDGSCITVAVSRWRVECDSIGRPGQIIGQCHLLIAQRPYPYRTSKEWNVISRNGLRSEARSAGNHATL